jgi:hypothetical protein
MPVVAIYLAAVVLLGSVWGCRRPERKSASYYKENRAAITRIRGYYDTLYRQQPFSAGFTDRSFKYYALEVITDTVKYVYNTEKSEKQLYETVLRFAYDTAMVKKLAKEMKGIRCLWVDKAFFYLQEKKEKITFVSFRSVSVDKPFTENKYYILLFPDHPLDNPDLKTRAKKGGVVRIDDQVYFMIGNNFR